MVARKTRVREKLAMKFVDDNDSAMAALSQGIVQHHRDDHWFHGLREFVELNLEFSIEIRELLEKGKAEEAGFRPHLVGHIVIEMLLDGWLAEKNIRQLDEYYVRVAAVDPAIVEQGVNRIATQGTDLVVKFIPRFIEEAYLYDYVDDLRVRYRMNRVLKRVKLAALPESFVDWLPNARARVYELAPVLLDSPVNQENRQ